jgi:type I restriction enzyme M protein
MAIAAKTATRKPRKKKVEDQRVATLALPALADEHLDVPTLETWLWDAACAIRGAADAPKFKDFILPLVFFKRLSDVFDDEFAAQINEFGDEDVAREVIRADHEDALKNNRKPIVRFFIPHEYRWDAIRNHATDGTLGQFVTDAMREVAKLNPELLGVLDIKDYNERQSGQRTLDDDRLAALIEVVSRHRLGLTNAEPDILGRAYEYLLRKFAEGQGQSAGEFYTPKEVGWLMAHLLDPKPYTTVYDPTCGSAGLLIKARLLFEQKNPEHKSKAPRLYGQEMNPVTFAMAKMNVFLHDYTDSLFAIGDTFTKPGFAAEGAGLKRFDYVVANPMWNQDNYGESLYENDQWKRFERPNGCPPLRPGEVYNGAAPSSSADWGWLQHIAASLNDSGRAAVVLDTGAVSRGSGSKSSNKEKTIRQAFVEADLIEAVVLLPENLFYNTTAPGIVVVLNRHKDNGRRGQFLLINASAHFAKRKPKNELTDEGIAAVAEVFHKWESREKLSRVVRLEGVREADYNLSPSLYVEINGRLQHRSLAEILADLDAARMQREHADTELRKLLESLSIGDVQGASAR